jgi:hypothetical protein
LTDSCKFLLASNWISHGYKEFAAIQVNTSRATAVKLHLSQVSFKGDFNFSFPHQKKKRYMNLKHFYFVTAALHSRSQNTKVAESSKAQLHQTMHSSYNHTTRPSVLHTAPRGEK